MTVRTLKPKSIGITADFRKGKIVLDQLPAKGGSKHDYEQSTDEFTKSVRERRKNDGDKIKTQNGGEQWSEKLK